jgi:hypothetical protein
MELSWEAFRGEAPFQGYPTHLAARSQAKKSAWCDFRAKML